MMRNKRRHNFWLTTAVCLAGTFAILSQSTWAQEPAPSKGHEILKKDVGTWKAKMEMFIGPDGTPLPEPMVSKGVEKNRMLGDHWLVGDYQGNIGGMDFKGHSVIGYSSSKKIYFGTWIDSMNPNISKMSGTYHKDKDAMIWEMTMVGPDGMPAKAKTVQEYKDGGNTRVFTMYNVQPDSDKTMKSMVITYTKVKED